MRPTGWATRDRVTLLAAVLAPLALCAALAPFRSDFANTNAALLLVLVVVAVAANGNRLAGVLAAISAGVWFDFFLTQPYEHFTISNRSDLETAVLLLLVAVGVTELAAWGRRQHLMASRQAGYLAGIRAAAEVVATGGALSPLVEQVAEQLTRILGVTRCRFDYGTALDHPRLGRDGRITWRHEVWDVERRGMPVERDTELVVATGSRFWGRFLLNAAPDTRPTLAQRLVAVALADQVGAGMSDYALTHPSGSGQAGTEPTS